MKFFSAIALLGTAQLGFASPGRFDLKHRYPEMEITETTTGLKGRVFFSSPDDSRFAYNVDYYDLSNKAEGTPPTTCLVGGSSILKDWNPTKEPSTSEAGWLDQTSDFDLPASVWVGESTNTAVICARIRSSFNDEEIDVIETLATITRSFTGKFSITVGTKTENAQGFTDADNKNEVEVARFLCDVNDREVADPSVEFARGQDFKICVRANASTDEAYKVDALKNVTCSYGSSPVVYSGQIRDKVNDSLCLYRNDQNFIRPGKLCDNSEGATVSFEFDDNNRLVDPTDGACLYFLYEEGQSIFFRACDFEAAEFLSFQYKNNQIQTTDGQQCISPHPIHDGYFNLQECTDTAAIFTMGSAPSELLTDTLVDGSGNAVGLADVSLPGSVTMSFTGVVKSKYFDNGNDELLCSGDVELSLASASRRLEATKNVRFIHRASALQTRAMQTRDLKDEVETEFSVGIKLDPGSSSAAVSNGMTSMGLMAAAGVVIAMI